MDIQTRKIEFVQEFLKLQNEEVILHFEKLLKSTLMSSSDKIKRMSVEEINLRIDQSLSDSENDNITKTDDLISEIEGWR